jgi:hypothetical protein
MGTNAVVLSQRRVAWTLGSDSFDQLWAAFHSSRSLADTAYEQLYQRLVNFFDWHGCAFPEELTDETFYRVARRLAEEEVGMSLPDYCFGVAHKLVWEVRLAEQKSAELGTAEASSHRKHRVIRQLPLVIEMWAQRAVRRQNSGSRLPN